jgi:hypothetical protein
VPLVSKRLGESECFGRENLTVLDIYRSRLYELICLNLLFPSAHHLLIFGLYNPRKHTYKDADLMNYLIDFVDCVLEKNPNIRWFYVVVISINWTCA